VVTKLPESKVIHTHRAEHRDSASQAGNQGRRATGHPTRPVNN
jgi:hypothetical protein